jgi:PadR family transcriptional regulator PadR
MRIFMPDQHTDLIQGTLEMQILKTLALTPMHGYGIALRIEQISDGAFRVNPGSLMPALSRMERSGRVKGEWRATENNRRARYYALTEKVARPSRAKQKSGGARSPPSTASSRHSDGTFAQHTRRHPRTPRQERTQR